MRRGRDRDRGRALPGAVAALCRALPPRARPAPDTLRRARFDRPQASLQFWRLLYSLLKQVHGGQCTESDATDTQIRFVKSALWYHGYGRPELYWLPSDGSAGSRELLLAFSWLLHRIGLLEQLLARNRVRTGDETSVCTCEDDLPNSQKGRTEIAPEYSLEDKVDVRYLQWLNGRLRFQWRSLHALHQEQCKLLHKIHLFTSGSHMDKILGHFSVTETDLIRRPENYKQPDLVLISRFPLPFGEGVPELGLLMGKSGSMCHPSLNILYLQPAGCARLVFVEVGLLLLLQFLESETIQLEAFLEWKQLEQVYWRWMETVLDNMSEEGSMCKSQDAHTKKSTLSKVDSCCHWAGSLTGKIDRLSRDLMTVHDQLQELVTHRKSAWYEKMKTREEELQKEEFCAAARKIQEAVQLKLLDLTYRCAPRKKKMHGSCRLVFRSKHSASKTGFGRSVSKEPISTVSATEVIRELQMRKASLERELKQLQEECRQRMDEVAQGLDGVICISP